MKNEGVGKRVSAKVWFIKENWDSVFSAWKNFVLLIFNLDKKADNTYGTKQLIHIIISTLEKKHITCFTWEGKNWKTILSETSWNLNNVIRLATFIEYWSCAVLKAFVPLLFPNLKWTLWGILSEN